jgi:uncharacterized protein (TIGR02246 family)
MKTLLTSVLAAAAVAAGTAGISQARSDGDRDAVIAVLGAYEAALNASNTDAIVPLYAEDGVFMPQHNQPSVGSAAIRAAYDGVFNTITLEIEFEIDEISQIAPDWVFARTRSSGFVTINATGQRGPEANQELFLFNRSPSGEWHIARYIFSTTNPPRQ